MQRAVPSRIRTLLRSHIFPGNSMSDADLSKLRIERGPRRVRPRAPAPTPDAVAPPVVALAARGPRRSSRAIPVETAAVTTAYPSQAYTLLNATGYVVAQRKAAVASKATGRLEWLGVREGSRVKENEILARLENKDVTARWSRPRRTSRSRAPTSSRAWPS